MSFYHFHQAGRPLTIVNGIWCRLVHHSLSGWQIKLHLFFSMAQLYLKQTVYLNTRPEDSTVVVFFVDSRINYANPNHGYIWQGNKL